MVLFLRTDIVVKAGISSLGGSRAKGVASEIGY